MFSTQVCCTYGIFVASLREHVYVYESLYICVHLNMYICTHTHVVRMQRIICIILVWLELEVLKNS